MYQAKEDWIAVDDGTVFVYHASSETRMLVATTIISKLIGYMMNTPEDAGRTQLYAEEYVRMIENNLKITVQKYPYIRF